MNEGKNLVEKNNEIIDLDADKKFKFWLKLAKENRKRKDWEKTLECYNKAIEYNPNEPAVWYNKSTIYYKQGKINKTLNSLKKVIELNKDFIKAHIRLGLIYKKQKEYDLAREHFLKALQLDQKSENPREALATLYMEIDDIASAQKHYEFLVKYINKKNAIAWNNLSWIYINKENYDKAIEAARNALKYRKNFIYSLDNLAVCYVRTNKLKKAAKIYKKILKINPKAHENEIINIEAYKKVQDLI